jgi:hypothetical protein
MVNENRGHLVSFPKEETSVLSNKASNWGLELIDGDALTRLGGRTQFLG